MERAMITFILAVSLFFTGVTFALAHSDRREKRPQIYAEAFISMTKQEYNRQKLFRHPPGNVRVNDMHSLFAGKILVVDKGRKYSTVPGVVDHALKIIFIGNDQRYVWCSYGSTSDYYHRNNRWNPVKYKHDGKFYPLLSTRIPEKDFDPKRPGLSPLYEPETGRIVFYGHRNGKWHTWDPGHIQERLPRAVYTLCPDFPSPEELGVEVNSKQTAVTYDKLLEQDSGRRVLRPDLVTLNPVEIAE